MSDINFDSFEPLEPPELSRHAEPEKKRGRPAGAKNKKIKKPTAAKIKLDDAYAVTRQNMTRSMYSDKETPQVNSLTVATSIVQMLKAYSPAERDHILDSVKKVLE